MTLDPALYCVHGRLREQCWDDQHDAAVANGTLPPPGQVYLPPDSGYLGLEPVRPWPLPWGGAAIG